MNVLLKYKIFYNKNKNQRHEYRQNRAYEVFFGGQRHENALKTCFWRPAFNPPRALLDPVDVKDAVKMVGFVLEDDRCEPAYCVGHGRDLLLIPAKTLPAKLFPAIGP